MTPKALSKGFEYQNLWLVFNKQEWLMNPLIKWTEEEIDNADEKGFIGTKYGVDCYLARKLPTVKTTNSTYKREVID